MEWKEVEEDRPYCETWVCGEDDLGCGVHKTENGWASVVVIYNETYNLPLRTTKEEAMKEAEKRFNKLYESYHEDVN